MTSIWRKALRSVSCLVLAVVVFFGTQTVLWIPLLLMSAFFFAVDIRGFGTVNRVDSQSNSFEPESYGVLGDYVVDHTPSYGLFIRLADRPVLIDIRQDHLIEARKTRAVFLFEHQDQLSQALADFIAANPKYADRTIDSIGLHATDIEQGEVFWDPSGYTLLKGLRFTE